jgi:hypothetical protein
MYMRSRIAIAVLGLSASVADADHHGMAMGTQGGSDDAAFGAGVSLLAASYSTMDYIGDYEGVVPALSWGTPRLSVAAALPIYRLEANGLQRFGPGDVIAHAQYALVARTSVVAGAMLALTAPTGDSVGGLGMGHPMVMPAMWAAWHVHRVTLTASGGYGRALTFDNMSSHHDHGPWPLVEPMNMSELTWSAAADVALGDGIHGGAHVSGGVPVGEPGHDRLVGALRLAWGTARVETAVELQAGLVGDPFTIRGLAETALHF